MRTGMNEQAFTVVEISIFLAITMGLFLLAGIMLNGQQAKTQFVQSVQDFQSKLADITNDVATGNFKNTDQFTCTEGLLPTDPVQITVAAGNQGTNTGCIAVGEVMQFTTGSSDYRFYTLAGKQNTIDASGITSNTQDIIQALPVKLIDTATTASTTETISYGTVVGRVTFDNAVVQADGTTNQTANGVIFASTFGQYDSNNALTSGDVQVDLIPITGSDIPDSTLPLTAVPSSIDLWTAASLLKNPKNGVKICLQDDANNPTRHADILLGGSGRQFGTTVFIGSGACL